MFKFQPVLCVLAIAAVMTVCGVKSASAQTFYDNRQAFNEAVQAFSIESFELPFASGASVQLPSVLIEEISPLPSLRRSTAATFSTAGFASLEYFSDGPSIIKFVFDDPITAFAIDFISFGNAGGGELTVEDNGVMQTSHVLKVAPPSLLPLNLVFVGYVSPDSPFTEVFLTSSTSGDTIAMDQLTFRSAIAVPEPLDVCSYSVFDLIVCPGQSSSTLIDTPVVAKVIRAIIWMRALSLYDLCVNLTGLAESATESAGGPATDGKEHFLKKSSP